jgi:hypothetical protein
MDSGLNREFEKEIISVFADRLFVKVSKIFLETFVTPPGLDASKLNVTSAIRKFKASSPNQHQ